MIYSIAVLSKSFSFSFSNLVSATPVWENRHDEHSLEDAHRHGLHLSLLSAGGAAEPGSCFLKNGDRWLFVGDSITNADVYRQVLLRVLQHYHPDADIIVGTAR